MSQVISEEDRGGVVVLVYDNGMIREKDSGRMVHPPAGNLIDGKKSIEFHRARQEKKRAVVLQAANEGVHSKAVKAEFGEWAFLAAIVTSAMSKAQNPKDIKSIEAARFLLSESGLSDSALDESKDNQDKLPSPAVVLLIAQLAERRRMDQIDAGVIDADSSGQD